MPVRCFDSGLLPLARRRDPRQEVSSLLFFIIVLLVVCEHQVSLAFSMNEPLLKRFKRETSAIPSASSSSFSVDGEDEEIDSSPLLFHPRPSNGVSLNPSNRNNNNDNNSNNSNIIGGVQVGRLEELKQQEQLLAAQLAAVRREKLQALHSRPLTIGLVGFGRFGQFIAKAFIKHGHNVVVTSRSDYTAEAREIGATYIPLDDPARFMASGLDVVVFCVSILSFEDTVRNMLPYLEAELNKNGGYKGPLVVDVLSVKEHPRQILLDLMPPKIDLLLTHPMFGPDSGKNGWHGLTFVYEKTRIDGVVLDPEIHPPGFDPRGHPSATKETAVAGNQTGDAFVDAMGAVHSVHEHSEAHVEAVDRMERFLSIWEEEGCHMVPMSCREHDAYAANSQFITHLMGRILGQQGLVKTPIDTTGFRNVLKLVDSTTADSFDLFYGLFKFNKNSQATISNLQSAMDDVVTRLQSKKKQETEAAELVRSSKMLPEQRSPSTAASASYLDSLASEASARK